MMVALVGLFASSCTNNPEPTAVVADDGGSSLFTKDPTLDTIPPDGIPEGGFQVDDELVTPGSVAIERITFRVDETTCEYIASITVVTSEVKKLDLSVSLFGDIAQDSASNVTSVDVVRNGADIFSIPVGVSTSDVHPKMVITSRATAIATEATPGVDTNPKQYDDIAGPSLEYSDMKCL